MLYVFKDSEDAVIGTYSLGDNRPEDYVGQTINGSVVVTVELEDPNDALTDRELTKKMDEELRLLIANLTTRVGTLETK